MRASAEPLADTSRAHLYFSPSRLMEDCFPALLQPGRPQGEVQTVGFEQSFFLAKTWKSVRALCSPLPCHSYNGRVLRSKHHIEDTCPRRSLGPAPGFAQKIKFCSFKPKRFTCLQLATLEQNVACLHLQALKRMHSYSEALPETPCPLSLPRLPWSRASYSLSLRTKASDQDPGLFILPLSSLLSDPVCLNRVS